MGMFLIVLVVADFALALFLIALSGFILQGVNNTGPMMPEAMFYVALIIAAIIAPVIALVLKRKGRIEKAFAIAAVPLVCAAAALLIQPS